MQAGFIPFCLQETITANTANAFTPSAAQLAVALHRLKSHT
jgi:hypothetical protein